MKKYFFLLLLFVSFFWTFNVFADKTDIVLMYDQVYMRTGPGTNYSSLGFVNYNDTFELANLSIIKSEKGCTDGWYKVYTTGTNVGYICSSYVQIKKVEISDPVVPSSDCQDAMKKAGFPSSYWNDLCALKTKYPNWTFAADLNGSDFATAVSKEAVGKKSLIQSSYQGYLSTASDSYNYFTDTFKVWEGSNWYAASSDVVAYYMDPRNFLDERSIFMFEKLSYDGEYQTDSAVRSVLAGRDIVIETPTIISASKEYNVNAIYLASRIRQETGGKYTNYSLMGNSVTVDGKYYAHIYNPYNIGAYGGAQDGIVWAATGTAYLKPWTNIQIAIRGGAYFIADSYISMGQDTGYFQKFNTSSYSKYSMFSHQYMSNVKAAASEASISYNSYVDMDLLKNTNFKFVIPVYSNMSQTKYELPNKGNPNNHLSALTVNNNTVTGFSHDKYEYTYYVSEDAANVDIGATAINSNAKINGTGKVNLPENDNVLKVTVTAENGKTQVYSIRVIKTSGAKMSAGDIVNQSKLVTTDSFLLLNTNSTVAFLNDEIKKISSTASVNVNNKVSGKLVTGDAVTIKNGTTSLTFNAVVKGDPTGDGEINIQDLLRIQKHILGYTNLSGSYLKACDNNNDGECNILDLLRTQKNILGVIQID